MDAFKNFAISEVATAPSPAVSGTSLTLKAGQGLRFPTAPYNVTIWPKNTLPDPANAEIVRVTARATDVLTITRAQEGTTARTILVGDLIAATITEKMITDLAGTTPAGGDTQIQYNDNGGLSGAPYLSYEKATGKFYVNSGLSVTGALQVTGPGTVSGQLNVGGNIIGGAALNLTGNATVNSLESNFHVRGVTGVYAGTDFFEKGRTTPVGHTVPWTPIWGGLVSPSQNNGQITRVGNLVFFSVLVLFGPSTYLSGQSIYFAIPIPMIEAATAQVVGEGQLLRSTGGVRFNLRAVVIGGGNLQLMIIDELGTLVGLTEYNPSQVVDGSQLFLRGWYQESGY